MIYFDVGANDGASSIHLAKGGGWGGSTVFAFEPNPEMITAIRQKIDGNHNYIIMPYAVSDYCGFAEFNVCITHDRGCSSLLDVSDQGKTEWGGRRDMIPNHKITVPVIRLDSWGVLYQINEIEYFHCDTQGSDLKVLQGMGYMHIKKIKAGQVEAAVKPDILYNGQNTVEETIDHLNIYGFAITGIQPNDVQGNEVNIHFKRP